MAKKKHTETKPKSFIEKNTEVINELIELKKKMNEIEKEIEIRKTFLYKLINSAEGKTLKGNSGTITLTVSNNWSLPAINVKESQKILGESFYDYFNSKSSYGVESVTKSIINAYKNNENLSDSNKVLAKKLIDLIEIKQAESWKITPKE